MGDSSGDLGDDSEELRDEGGADVEADEERWRAARRAGL